MHFDQYRIEAWAEWAIVQSSKFLQGRQILEFFFVESTLKNI